jgi:hypothetical protein
MGGRSPAKAAWRIAALYLVGGFLWFFLSRLVLHGLGREYGVGHLLDEAGQDLGFVLVTGVGLFMLLVYEFRRRGATEERLRAEKERAGDT